MSTNMKENFIKMNRFSIYLMDFFTCSTNSLK